MKRIVFFIAIVVVAVFALRTVLFVPGIIGHTWDWGIPNFPEQFRAQARANFSIWDDRLYGGFFFPTRLELPYWLFTLAFSPLGGDVLSKIIPLLIFIIAGASAFFAVRKIFALDYFWALMSAVLYMLSPFSYCRLIGGHLPILLGYAFLPLILYFSVSLFDLPVKEKTPMIAWKKMIPLILILSLGVLHPLVLLVSWGIIFLNTLIFFILKKGGRKKILARLFLVLVSWILLDAYWLLIILSQLFGVWGNLAVRPWEPVAEELASRLLYFNNVSRPLSELFTFSFPFGLHTEFVYPVADSLRPFFILTCVVLFATGVAALYLVFKKRKQYLPVVVMLTVVEIIGFAMVAGNKTIVGQLLFSMIIRTVPLIFSVFSNPIRLLPLVILPFSILPFISLAIIEKEFRHTRIFLRGLTALFILIFLYPWLFRDLKTPIFKDQSQPMSLKVTKINPEDRRVFDYLRQPQGDFRIVHLPPAFVSWPGETDLSYIWNTIFSPKPLFLEYGQPPLAGETIKSLYSQKTSKDLSKLLGLGAVKTIIYPHYQGFPESYQFFIKNTVNYKPIVDRNWSEQKDIKRETTDFTTVDLYENENFVPHIFVPEQITFTGGDQSLLVDVVSFPDYRLRNAIFSSLKEEAKTQFVLSKANDIYIKPNYIGEIVLPQSVKEEFQPAVRLLPNSPLYGFIKFKEERMRKAAGNNPHEFANTNLLLMSKRVAEIKEMVKSGNGREEWPKTARRYDELLDDFSAQLDSLIGKQGFENELLIKSLVFLASHQGILNQISQEVSHSELSQEIGKISNKLNQVFARIKKDVWVTEEEEEKKYLFTIPEAGDYLLFTSPEIKDEFNFEIDGKAFSLSGESINEQWLSYGGFTLEAGGHRLKLTLPEQPNLFSGLATSSAVQKLPPSNGSGLSYRFLAQKENSVISAQLAGLDDRSEYEVSFRYKNDGSLARFTIEQANDEIFMGSILHKTDEPLPAENRWRGIKTSFSPSFGSREATLKFYIPAAITQGETYYVEDIEIRKILKPTLLFKKEKKAETSQPPKITYVKINPNKYKVKIEEATNPYFLVFSETFHEGWKAYIEASKTKFQVTDEIISSYFNGEIKEGRDKNALFDKEIFNNVLKKPLSEENHFLVNAFANTWYIDKPGSYEITLEFAPQRIYFLGLLVAFACLMLLLASLLTLFITSAARRSSKFRPEPPPERSEGSAATHEETPRRRPGGAFIKDRRFHATRPK